MTQPIPPNQMYLEIRLLDVEGVPFRIEVFNYDPSKPGKWSAKFHTPERYSKHEHSVEVSIGRYESIMPWQ